MRYPSKRLICSLFLILCVVSALGCAVPEPPQLVSVSNPPVFRPASPQQVTSLEEALDAIITICTEDLGLPPVEPLYLHLYRSAHAYASYTNGFARFREDTVRFTLAQSNENQLHVNMERARGQSWGSLLRILAHDYGHNLEYVVSGDTKRRSEWMSEGFADWVAAKVMDSLGWEPYSSSLARAQRELSHYGSSPPRISQLETAADWSRVLEQPKGRIGTYDLAFVAVHKLIEKKGAAAVMDYFLSKNFPGSFGLTRSDFEREMQAAANEWVAPNKGGGQKAEKPEWKVGYKWQYALKAPGLKGAVLILNQIAREEVFENTPAYVLAIGRNEYPHAKDTLAVLATLAEGKTISKNNPPALPLAWPLEAGKQWQNNFAIENAEQKQSQKIDTEVVVAGVEEVRVPAGVFQAFKIDTYAAPTGELISEQWYAPRARWFVKSKIYREEGVIEQNLVSFKPD